MENLYTTLNIHQSASIEEIKKAYRILALKYHPDKNKKPNATQTFIEITNAYEILKDPIKRNIYDEKLISNSLIKITQEYDSWKKESESKAHFYSKMNYNDFEINLNKELKLFITNTPNFGCLAFITFGFVLSFWMLYKALHDNKEGMVGGSVLNLVVYGALVIWLYPKFTKKYVSERKDIYK